MNVTIKASVGRNAENNPNDVEKIVNLLIKVRVAPRTSFRIQVPKRISAGLVPAIENFQKLYGKADGVINPGKSTIRRLNELATPLKLNKITLGKITKGGYIISYTGRKPPAPYKIFLTLSVAPPPTVTPSAIPVMIDKAKSIDITDRKQNDLFGVDNLPNLLKLIKSQNLWGKKAWVALYVVNNKGIRITRSNTMSLSCPVKPISGVLKPELGEGDDGPKLTYTGIQTGRMLHHIPFNGDYYFKYAGKFETNNNKRGLNCITYVGAIFAVDSSKGAMSKYGTQLADELKAQKCEMEEKREADIKDFFRKNNKGNYIMWSASHVVLVANSKVHEFSESNRGYVKTDVQKWNFRKKTYWIRKITRGYGKGV